MWFYYSAKQVVILTYKNLLSTETIRLHLQKQKSVNIFNVSSLKTFLIIKKEALKPNTVHENLKNVDIKSMCKLFCASL